MQWLGSFMYKYRFFKNFFMKFARIDHETRIAGSPIKNGHVNGTLIEVVTLI